MKKVMCDIGHGGSDLGATGNGLIEKDLNLKVGLLVRDHLKNYKVEVKLTRDTDKTLTADQRVKLVNDYNPDLCVSIHHNAAVSTARGAEVIHAHWDEYDDILALSILSKLAKAGMPTRRAFSKLNERKSDYYYMVRRIWDDATDAIIIEGGFITNIQDAAMLKTDSYIKAQAQAIADSIVEYLQLEPIVITQEQEFNSAMEYISTNKIFDMTMYWILNAQAGKVIPGEIVQSAFIKLVQHAKALK